MTFCCEDDILTKFDPIERARDIFFKVYVPDIGLYCRHKFSGPDYYLQTLYPYIEENTPKRIRHIYLESQIKTG